MKKLTAPEFWSNKPEWFKNNEWMIQNQEHLFVKRLGNTIYQLQSDKKIKRPDQKPMEAVQSCFMGDIAANGTKFQFNETIKQLNTLTGDDLIKAKEMMDCFKNDFKDYLPFLEQS